MKHLPFWGKIIVNIVLYVFYVVVTSLVFSLLFPLVLQILWKEILDPYNPIFIKIQFFIAVVVLLMTLIGRKYFYTALTCPRRENKESYTQKKAQEKTQKKPEPKNEILEEQQSQDDEIRIYVDKEIK